MNPTAQQWLCRFVALVLVLQAPLVAAVPCAPDIPDRTEMSAMDCHDDMEAHVSTEMASMHDETGDCCGSCGDCAVSTIVIDTVAAAASGGAPACYRLSLHESLVTSTQERLLRPPIS